MRVLPFLTDAPWIIAHRGASAELPENSLAALQAAVSMGSDAIEVDLRLSADGVPVLVHDPDLRRVAGQDLVVARLSAVELEPFLLTLEAALDLQRDLPMLLEMKVEEGGGEERKRQLALETGRLARRAPGIAPVLLSFDPELLAWAGAEAPQLGRARNFLQPGRADAEILSCAVGALNREWVEQVQARGQRVLTFVVHDAKCLEVAHRAGVDGYFTGKPDWLRQALMRMDP